MLGQERFFHSERPKNKHKGHGCPMMGLNTPSASKEDKMILTGG
jgi:hypothetical protein